MDNKISKTMFAVALIRSESLNDQRSKTLIKNHEDEARSIQSYIDTANGGMFTSNIKTRDYYFSKQLIKNIDYMGRRYILFRKK